jgi:hypothetical protein
MSYLYVKWNSFARVRSPMFPSLEHVRGFYGPYCCLSRLRLSLSSS